MWLWVWQGLWGTLAIVLSVFAGLFFGLAMTGFSAGERLDLPSSWDEYPEA